MSSKALEFTLGSLSQFADAGPFGLIGLGLNALVDLWDVSEERAVNLARVEEKELALARINKLSKRHEAALERLTRKAEAMIRSKEQDTREVVKAYREDVRALLLRIKQLERRKRAR